jgi:hypothetical protein
VEYLKLESFDEACRRCFSFSRISDSDHFITMLRRKCICTNRAFESCWTILGAAERIYYILSQSNDIKKFAQQTKMAAKFATESGTESKISAVDQCIQNQLHGRSVRNGLSADVPFMCLYANLSFRSYDNLRLLE